MGPQFRELAGAGPVLVLDGHFAFAGAGSAFCFAGAGQVVALDRRFVCAGGAAVLRFFVWPVPVRRWLRIGRFTLRQARDYIKSG